MATVSSDLHLRSRRPKRPFEIRRLFAGNNDINYGNPAFTPNERWDL